MTSRSRYLAILAAVGLLALGAWLYTRFGAVAPGGSEDAPGGPVSSEIRAERASQALAAGVTIVPGEAVPRTSPLLGECASWPAGPELHALPAPPGEGEASASGRPPVHEIRALIEMARPLVHPSLFPKNPEEALRVDATGRLILVLGDEKTGPYGQTSRDFTSRPAIAFRWSFPAARDMTEASILARLQDVSSPELAEELCSEGTRRSPHKELQGPDGFQATYALDRSGFGTMHPWAILYGRRDALAVIFQQIEEIRDPADRRR